MRIGYARVTSQPGELVQAQIQVLLDAGCGNENIYIDQIAGAGWPQPELARALESMRYGDTLVVARLDSLGRNVRETILTMSDLGERNINIQVLDLKLDTSDPMQRVVLDVMASLAEWEHNLFARRTREGVAHARAEGRVAGPKPKLTLEQTRLIREAIDCGKSVASQAREFGVSRQTVYRALEKESQ